MATTPLSAKRHVDWALQEPVSLDRIACYLLGDLRAQQVEILVELRELNRTLRRMDRRQARQLKTTRG